MARVIAEQEGVVVSCVDCPATVILPFADATKSSVLIYPLSHWTAPPPRCTACSQRENDRRNGTMDTGGQF